MTRHMPLHIRDGCIVHVTGHPIVHVARPDKGAARNCPDLSVRFAAIPRAVKEA